MSGDLIRQPRAPRLGVVDQIKQQRDQRKAEIEVARRANLVYVEEVTAELREQQVRAEQARVAGRTQAAILGAKSVYDTLVSAADGDETAAAFLAPIALRGRDHLQRLV